MSVSNKILFLLTKLHDNIITDINKKKKTSTNLVNCYYILDNI